MPDASTKLQYIIRPAVPADAAAIIGYMRAIADEPNNGISYSSAADFQYTVEEEAELIRRNNNAENARFIVAVADGQIIGVVSCAGGSRGYYGTLRLGITVHKDWRNRGVGTAMLRYLIEWCRQNPVVHRLELDVYTDNLRAIHVYEKLGFVREGVRRQAFWKEGDYKDLLFMAILFDR